jgi:vacuolar-type H+-ATPase subunit H
MAMQPEKSSQFDPEKMRQQAEQMIKDGKMPSEEQFRAAMDRIRKKYGPEIVKARKQTEQ